MIYNSISLFSTYFKMLMYKYYLKDVIVTLVVTLYSAYYTVKKTNNIF